jgi:hypothetical protein
MFEKLRIIFAFTLFAVYVIPLKKTSGVRHDSKTAPKNEELIEQVVSQYVGCTHLHDACASLYTSS